ARHAAVDLHLEHARSVVAAAALRAAHALVGIGREQPPALGLALEGQANRGTVELEAAARGRRLAEPAGKLVAILSEHDDVRREWIVDGEFAYAQMLQGLSVVIVAAAGQAGARLEHDGLKLVLVADKRDVRRHVEVLREHLDLETLRYDDVLAAARVVEGRFDRTVRIGLGLSPRNCWNGRHTGQGKPDRNARQLLLRCY